MDVVYLIIFGSLGMLVLAGAVVLFVIAYQKKVLTSQNEMAMAENKFQQQLIEATLLTEQAEREKISRNLHDDLGTSLNILRLHMEKLSRNNNNPALVKDISTKTLDMLSHSIQDLRQISRDLMPATLMKLGFIQSVTELTKHINETGNTAILLVNFTLNKKLEERQEVQLYRICQEVLNNLIKHSAPKNVQIELKINERDKQLSLIFTHDGKGITNEDIQKIYALNKGVGLKSIESRIRMINGNISYIHKHDNQPSIEITAPTT